MKTVYPLQTKFAGGINMIVNTRIYQEYEGRVDKSVRNITVWHHEAFRVMTNDNPEGRIFLAHH